MNSARLVVLILVLILVCALALVLQQLRLVGTESALEAAQASLHQSEQLSTQRQATITSLQTQARINAQAQAEQRSREAEIRATLHRRELTIRSLQRENDEMRQWAGVSLPDAVVRLREHPTYTGAAAYRERLPHPDTVQPAGDVGPH